MNPSMQLEREEKLLEEQLNGGLIDNKEFNQRLIELQRAYQEEARESARQAYEDELDRW